MDHAPLAPSICGFGFDARIRKGCPGNYLLRRRCIYIQFKAVGSRRDRGRRSDQASKRRALNRYQPNASPPPCHIWYTGSTSPSRSPLFRQISATQLEQYLWKG